MTDSDSDLEGLAKEMDFSTPMKTASNDNVTLQGRMDDSDITNQARVTANRVLISNPSLTNSSILGDKVEKVNFKTENMFTNLGLNDDKELGTSKNPNSYSKKYKLFFVENVKVVCGHVMSQGIGFCGNINCTRNHKSEVFSVKESHFYVESRGEKDRRVVFMEPAIDISNIDASLAEEWKEIRLSMEDWKNQFRLLANNLEEGNSKVSKINLEEENRKMKSLRAYKTPKKERINSDVNEDPPLKYAAFEPNSDDSAEEQATQYMSHIEKVFTAIHVEMQKIHRNQVLMSTFMKESAPAFDVRLKDLEEGIGRKPGGLSNEIDALNVWGVIANLVNQLETKGIEKPTIKPLSEDRVRVLIDEETQPLSQNLRRDLEASVTPLNSRMDNLKASLINTARSLKGQVLSNTNELGILQSMKGTSYNEMSDIQRLEERILELEKETSKLAIAEDKAIKFFNLGFTSKGESDSWLELNAAHNNFGFVVDCHILLEHIHHSITGMDALKQLQTVYKLQLSTISEALSVTSFEVSTPRFLSASGQHRIIGNESSYFSHIPTYAKWNEPSSGYKVRLKKELEIFRRAHLSSIRERLPPSTQLYHLAMSSMSESIAWILGLINYIDCTYDEYVAGKFGTAKAWHVSTKLAMGLLNEVAKPREGALQSFEAGSRSSISKVIFYSVLRSLDVMGEIAALDYRDSPVVSTELVKFLSLNTSVEAVEKLEKQSEVFNTSIKDLTKDVSATTKSNHSIGNKTDELKKVVETLKKRIEKIENKK